VSGVIERQSGGPKQNYVVGMVGKFSAIYRDSIVEIISYSSNEISKYVTDTSGYFYIEARSSSKADSIAIKISAVDKLAFVSQKWLIPSTGLASMGESGSEQPGCTGCGATEVTSEPYIKGYLYMFEEQRITIPD
jgi:hypothetical protein